MVQKRHTFILKETIKEYSVLFASIYLPQEHAGIALYWEIIQKDTHITYQTWFKGPWLYILRHLLDEWGKWMRVRCVPLCGCPSNEPGCQLAITMGSLLLFLTPWLGNRMFPTFPYPSLIQTPTQFLPSFKCCSQPNDKTRNVFWGTTWILCELVTSILFLAFLSVLECWFTS